MSVLEGRLGRLAQRYRITLTALAPDDWDASAEQGDCNCPILGRYNPENGHGYSYVSTDDEPIHVYPTAQAALDELERRIERHERETPLAVEEERR